MTYKMKRSRTMAQKREESKSKNNDSSIIVKVEEEEMPSSEPKRTKVVKVEEDEAVIESDSKHVDLTKIAAVGVVDPPPTKIFTECAKIENSENHEQPSPLCVLDDDEFAAAVIEWAEQNGY